jgi:hypothetical protein
MSADFPKIEKDKAYEFKPFRVPKYRIEFQNATSLSDIQGYVWYTPAILYLWGRYSEVNLSDLVQRHDIKIFWYKFNKPIFQGLSVGGDPSWNHTLWAAEQSQWLKLVNGILETVQFDTVFKKIYQYALQNLNVYDPFFADNKILISQNAPTINVNVFAVLSNERQYAFDTRDKEIKLLPQVLTFKPDKMHVNAANKLFSQPNLSQEKAFNAYKQVLLEQQDEQFNEKKSRSINAR